MTLLKFPKGTHLALFYRDSLEHSVICISDCGHLFKFYYSYCFKNVNCYHPCYGDPGVRRFHHVERARPFSSATAALKAMREYEKNSKVGKAELIGFL